TSSRFWVPGRRSWPPFPSPLRWRLADTRPSDDRPLPLNARRRHHPSDGSDALPWGSGVHCDDVTLREVFHGPAAEPPPAAVLDTADRQYRLSVHGWCVDIDDPGLHSLGES